MTAHIPKAELHVHLEGAASPSLVRSRAAHYGLDTTGIFDASGSYAWHDFTSFLRAYDLAASVFRTPEDFSDLAFDYLARSHEEGCIYTEVFASPDHGAAVGLSYADYIGGISDGMDRAEAAFGIHARIVPICVRHLGRERAVKVAQDVVNHSFARVVGFGMAGEERVLHPADFRAAYAICGEAGLALTVHAGELAGPESVRAAIDSLPVTRIGHGVRAMEDQELVRRLAAEGHVLECCPGSNVALRLYPDFSHHPFAFLRAAGVKVTLSSDDPPFFHTSIGAEYANAALWLHQCEADLVDITRLAIQSAFCDAALKEQLLARTGVAGSAVVSA